MKLVLFVLLTIILYSIISNFLIGGLISVVNYNSYKLAFADDSNTSESSDNKDTGYAGDNKDNVITKEASKDQKEHSSNSDQNTENSTEIGKLQVDVKLEQPVHGGEKQKITVKVTNSSLDPIKGAKVTGTVKILSHKMELSEKTSNSGKVHFSIEIGAQSEPSVAKISLKTSAKGYDSESSKVFFNILPDKTEQEGKDKEQKVSSTDTKKNANGQQESNTDRNEKSITISTDSSTMNSNQDSCDEGESKKRNDNEEKCDPPGLLSDVIINSVNDGNGKKLSNNETTTADNLELTFSDHGNSSVNTFDCSLDGKSAEECTSPYVIENISLGSHRFQVRGIEDDQEASYDTYSWIRKEKVELKSALESSNQSPSLTQLVLPQGSGPVNPIDGNGDGIKDGSTIQPNNISESQPQNMPLFPLLALDTSGPVVTSTDPINGTTEVPLDKVITATFNETVQSSTVNSSSFILKTGSTTVPGSVSLSSDGQVATFTPSDPLTSFTSYVASITRGVKGTDGNPLQNEEVWSFTTIDTSPPDTVIDSSIDGNGDDIKDGKKTDSDTMSFTFSSNKANSTFECSRDGSSFKKCDEEFTLSSSGFQSYSNLKDGKHKFEVVATSGAGVKDPSPAKFSWTVKTEEDTSSDTSNIKIGNIPIPNIAPFNVTNGTTQISPGNNNVTVAVPGYGNVSLEFTNLTQAGSVTVQALLFTPELQKTGIQNDVTTGLKRISMTDGQLFTLVGTVFNISSTDASFTGPIKISIPYNNTILSQISSIMAVDPESQIRFLHYDGTTWNDETSAVSVVSTHVMGSTNNLGLVVAAVRPSAVPVS